VAHRGRGALAVGHARRGGPGPAGRRGRRPGGAALAGRGPNPRAGGARAEQRWRPAASPAARPLLALVVLACAGTLACIDTGYPLARPLQLAAATGGAAAACMESLAAMTDPRCGA